MKSLAIPILIPSGRPEVWRRPSKRRSRSGLAPWAETISEATFRCSLPKHCRFLVEVIQNADDQAVRANLGESLVTITRVGGLIAVGNSGQPFDKRKVDAITSIFKSDKSADECIGNKGIGFKAVFQIADSAEILSSTLADLVATDTQLGFDWSDGHFDEGEFVAKCGILLSNCWAVMKIAVWRLKIGFRVRRRQILSCAKPRGRTGSRFRFRRPTRNSTVECCHSVSRLRF